MHQGEKLGLFLRINNIQKGDFAKKTGMSRGTLYSILKDKLIKGEYMDAIRKAGYNFDAFVQTGVQSEKPPAPVIHNTSELEKKIQELQNENSELLHKVISLHERLDKKREQFEKQIERRMDKVLAAVLSEKKN